MKVERNLFVIALCCLFLIPIQAQELMDYPLDTINGEEVYKYEVERSIGLYRIGVNFHVPQGEIIRLNPQLRERGLHFGETLFIPTGRAVSAQEPVAEPTQTQAVAPIQEPAVAPVPVQPVIIHDTIIIRDTVVIADTTAAPAVSAASVTLPDSIIPRDTIVTTDTLVMADTVVVADTVILADTIKVMTAKDSLRSGMKVMELALMLPFESQQTTKRSANAERMMEFYQGALLALREMQNDSIFYCLRVYDTERSERKIAALCDSTELDSVRGILGPVYPIQIARMTEWCEAHEVPLLLPFSDDVNLSGHPRLLQFNSTDIQEADSLCAWIAARDSLLRCISLDVKEADMSAASRILRKQLKANQIKVRRLPLRDLMIDSAAYALDTAKENLILFHTDRYQHVRLLLPHLSKLQDEGYKLRIVSQYSWQKENIDLPQLYTSMFTSEADREAYDELWAKYYVTNHVSDAPRYDLLGYDLMRALIDRINGREETNGLQSSIRWKQQEENGGYQNECVKVVER